MDLELNDKVIIVTGGAAGIGEAISLQIAEEGGIPVIVGRNSEAADKVIEKLEKKNSTYLNIIKELGTPESCKEVIQKTIENLGRIDGLVNNAGANDKVGLENGSPEKYLASLEKNLHHYYYLAHYALPYLKKSKGSIVNISSKTAVTGQGDTSAYAAAKGAQLAFTREWAVELLPFEIRVNAVIPAEVMTPLYQNWLNTFDNPEEKLQGIVSKIPLGNRMTTAEEIANAVLFLLSAKASHITGQHYYVDGGYVHLDRSINKS